MRKRDVSTRKRRKTTLKTTGIYAMLVLVALATSTSMGGLSDRASGVPRSYATTRAKLKTQSVIVRVFPLGSDASGQYDPKMFIAVINQSNSVIYVSSDMRGVWDKYNALRAEVIDEESGKSLGLKIHVDTVFTGWRESYFVPLAPSSACGPIVDLRNLYLLERGHRYKVRYVYTMNAPAKVGRIKPWKGVAWSEPVTITMPRD